MTSNEQRLTDIETGDSRDALLKGSGLNARDKRGKGANDSSAGELHLELLM